MGNKNLFYAVTKIWQDNYDEFEKKLNVWLDALQAGANQLILSKKEFHRWDPLGAYVSVTKAKSRAKSIFSLRFFGQEVANLTVKDKQVLLVLGKKHETRNKRWFKALSIGKGEYFWNGEQAKELRAYFKNIAVLENGKPDVRSVEHRIESKFIIEMSKGYGKFGIDNLRIQPVVIADKFPLQIPVPISASTGEPKPGNGYIDILARHRLKNNKTNLSVWELKKPGAYQYAASQAYIYALTLLKVIRHSKRGAEWFKLFGSSGQIPKSLEIEAIVAIDRKQERGFKKELDILMKETPLAIENDKIKLLAAYYIEKSRAIILEQDPFTE
jgi:hypothetical protein